ncbi:extracellular solute-binding protein [Kribbella sp. NPDC050124]|uniref:extracellular solute-binding protein n=1 Tax=Kribbella sp. NPDC050124 TaxID=3364114 RepID=UPI003790D4A0
MALRILCWDHPRCVSPVRAAAAAWERQHGTAIAVAARPLAAFNDQPIGDIARTADLLFIDHPMVGRVAREEALVPLESLLDASVLDALAADSIGRSHESYNWGGSQWAVAVDAACQVAVVDDSTLDEWGDVPRRWDDVLAAARKVPGSVALPLYPSDAVLSLLSISAELSTTDELWVEEAVDIFVELVRGVDPRSFQLNPPGLLDLMSSESSDAPVYAPLLFGYTNYQRPAARGRPLRFCRPPSVGERPAAVLGGAGLAVSASSKQANEAAAFAALMAGADVQRTIVLGNDGQPASRSVWFDPSADEVVGGFFSGTRTTIESSYLRPRAAWWPAYQEAAGIRLTEALRRGDAASAIHADLNDALNKARDKEHP